MTIFNADDAKERRFVPWEIKEATFKAGMGCFGAAFVNMYMPLGSICSLAQAGFIINYTLTVSRMMSNAVTRIDLLDDGTKVNLTFGRTQGKVVTVAIKDIQK